MNLGISLSLPALRRPAASASAALSLDFTASMPGGVTVVSSPAGYAPKADGTLQSFTANAGRRTNAGLLVEAGATNLARNSVAPAPSNGWGGGAATITAGQAADPAGGTAMASLVEDTSNGGHFAFGDLASTQTSGVFTVSAWVAAKGATRSASLRIENQNVFFDLVGVVAFTNTIQAATIKKVGSFYYLTATFNYPSNWLTAFLQIGNSSGGSGYLGDGSSGLYYWGFQVETGALATSLISTTTASVARAADSIQFTIPAGITNLTYTFDDSSTQLVSGVTAGTYTIPTTLNRPQIKTIVGS
jgi:hypothetical protein